MASEEGASRAGGRLGPLAEAIVGAASTAQIGLAVTYVDGDVPRNVFVNDAFAAMLGYTVDEMLSLSPMKHIVDSDLQRLRERYSMRQAGEKGSRRYELQLIRKDGALVDVDVTASDVVFEGHRATIAFMVDITSRHRAEESAHRTEETFRDLIEIAPEAIGILRAGRFLYANAAYVKMLGFDSAAELIATPLDDIVVTEDHAVLRARERRILGDGLHMPNQIYHCKKRDGSIILIEVSSVPMIHQGQPAVLGVGRDVTERKRMEAQLVQADRLAALGTLAAGVAHEVNNPLAYLSLNLEWLARKLPEIGGDPSRVPELSAMLEEARHGAERVGAIVRELRAFSRADGETRRHVDLRVAVASAIKLASHEIRHRAKITTDLEENAPPVWANEARLEQVLLNLLLNAVQAMPETSADTNEIRVTVRARADERVVLEVSDNGAGIPPETVRRIFDPFFTTKPVGVGTGLGLSICHSIITSLGGQISVDSTVGEGSTFRIVLPTRPSIADSGRPSTDPASADVPSLARARVLVIDDEVTIANTLRELLYVDHDVTAVTSGEEALALVKAGADFDVVFCDLMMPKTSGMDLHEKLAAIRPGLEKRMVFMTGGAFTSRAADFLAQVKNRRIEKPFSLSAIEAIVRAMTGGSSAGSPGRQGQVA